MTYLELIRDADRQLDDGRITIGEYEQMITPLNQEIQPERKHGKWKPVEPPWFECSECGAWRRNAAVLEYFCPNCGADMRGGDSNE